MPTATQIDRVKKEWSKLAQEPVEITATEDWIYAHGPELAVLRIYWSMRGAGRVEKRASGWVYFKECRWS